MAKGDGSNPQGDQLFQELQQLFQNPQAMQAIGGAMKGGPQGGNPITGNPQNFMAGMRKTMGNPNPVNPYGFVPPSQRMGYEMGMPSSRSGMQAPQMNMPSANPTMGGGNTGITGGMNKTYAPSPQNPIASTNMGMNMPPAIRMGSSGGMETAGATGGWSPTSGQQNNPYAPNKNFGMQSGSRPY